MNGNLQGQTLPTIDVHNKQELQWWAQELKVSEDRLRGAISQVGNSADAVRKVLRTPHAKSEQQNSPDRSSEVAASTAMAEAWHRAEAAKAAAARRARADAVGGAVPWVLGAAAVAVLVMAARKLGRRRG